jgi:hypothetical protein
MSDSIHNNTSESSACSANSQHSPLQIENSVEGNNNIEEELVFDRFGRWQLSRMPVDRLREIHQTLLQKVCFPRLTLIFV